MPYITEAEIAALLPAPFLLAALDDDQDGEADAGLLDQIIQLAGQTVDAQIAPRYATPRPAPAEALVRDSTLTFTLHSLYLRRGLSGDQNPYTAAAAAALAMLAKVGSGHIGLEPGATGRPTPTAALISQPSQTNTGGLRRLV